MLGKLLKYELKSIGRVIWPFYLITVALAALTGVLIGPLHSSELPVFFRIFFFFEVFLFAICLAATCIVTLVMCLRRFYCALLSDEGYLTHTLPVSTHEKILSQLFSACIWSILSMGVVCICFVIAVVLPMPEAGWGSIFASIPVNFPLVALSYVLSIAVSFLMFDVSMAIGYSRNNHRFLTSCGVFFLINIILSMLAGIGMSIIAMLSIDASWMLVADEAVSASLWFSVAVNVVQGVIFYFITHHFLEKKLNLS